MPRPSRATTRMRLCGLLLLGVWPTIASGVSIEPGDTVRVDFDFATAVPPPPYVHLQAGFHYGPIDLLDPGEGWTISVFDDEGSPPLFSFSFLSSSTTAGQGWGLYDGSPAFADGQGFLLLTDFIGTVDLISITFSAAKPVGYPPPRATGEVVDGAITVVPEPTALALLATGLAGIGFAQRRKLQTRSRTRRH